MSGYGEYIEKIKGIARWLFYVDVTSLSWWQSSQTKYHTSCRITGDDDSIDIYLVADLVCNQKAIHFVNILQSSRKWILWRTPIIDRDNEEGWKWFCDTVSWKVGEFVPSEQWEMIRIKDKHAWDMRGKDEVTFIHEKWWTMTTIISFFQDRINSLVGS